MKNKSPEVIMYSNFKDMKNRHGVYALLDMESCVSCSQYMKDLKVYNISDWTIVAMTKENSEEFFEVEGLKPPITRVYNNDLIEEEIKGILYAAQIKKVYNAFSKVVNSLNGQTNKTSSEDFEVVPAHQKMLFVQCFLVKRILDIEILGQRITARENQWVVMYEDNKIEVLDAIDFNRRFEYD
jgi:hypothetical protein